MYQTYNIAIRRQDKSAWERRTPLIPKDVKALLEKNKHLKIKVQPSEKRIFEDNEYKNAGAIIEEDISDCNLILGIKEIPVENLIPDKTFVFFSHVDKGEEDKMPALDFILENNIRLIDYEFIRNEKGERLIAFGRYAGIAGAIDYLRGLGEYLMNKGICTPLINVSQTFKYYNVQDAFNHLKVVGQNIKQKLIHKDLAPLIFCVTGRGRTAQGAMQTLKNLPIKMINNQELEEIWADKENPKHQEQIYLINVTAEDCMVPLDETKKFQKQDYYKNPKGYRCTFAEKYLPKISSLFHCIYWDYDFPRYIENSDLERLAKEDRLRLLGVCDITSDLGGSIECNTEYTTPDNPFYYFDTIEKQISYDCTYKQNKILYYAVDFIPSELPQDASTDFSKLLTKWIEKLATSDKEKPLDEQGLPEELKRAVIACGGKLTPRFEYIEKLREELEAERERNSKKKEWDKEEFDNERKSTFSSNCSSNHRKQSEDVTQE